jgi:hypothetical protein
MIRPGREQYMTTLTSSRVRSISIFGMPAERYLFLMNLRILTSSISSEENSCFEAYQRLFQPTMMPVRNPVGLTF